VPDGVAMGAAALFPAAAVRVTPDAVADAKIDDAAEGGIVVVIAVDDSTSVALAAEEPELADAESVELAEELESDDEDEPEYDESDDDEDELDDEVRTSVERSSTLASINAMVGPATTEFVARTTTSRRRGWLSLVM
jgi:hypothetical protein